MQARIAVIGAGDLGSAMVHALVQHGGVPPGRIAVASASGRAPRLADVPGLMVGDNAQVAAAEADIVLLAVPPAAAPSVALGAPRGPVLSVMAGVTLRQLTTIAGHDRVIRAMSSPAAALGLAYSPFVPGPGAREGDIALAQAVLGACGQTDRVPDEAQIDLFTALTGPVPGFVAACAAMMAAWAEKRGVSPDVADRAVRQLFRAGGEIMARTAPTPATRVQEMIDYAGTTAAGLTRLQASGAADDLHEALDAAVARARTIAGGASG